MHVVHVTSGEVHVTVCARAGGLVKWSVLWAASYRNYEEKCPHLLITLGCTDTSGLGLKCPAQGSAPIVNLTVTRL